MDVEFEASLTSPYGNLASTTKIFGGPAGLLLLQRQHSAAHLADADLLSRASHPAAPSIQQTHALVPHDLLEGPACWQALVTLPACEDAAVPFLLDAHNPQA